MRFNAISYLITEGFKNLFKNKKMSIASLIIICFTMLIFGIFFIIGDNVNFIMDTIAENQGIQVFINDVPDDEMTEIGEKIQKIEGVSTIKFVSKADALAQVKDRLKDKDYLLEGYNEKNPFPASYVITLTDLTLSNQIQSQIKQIGNVKKITSNDDTINAIISVGTTIRIVTIIIAAILVIISIFIISNTIKIAVHARRKEISIMKYVGATNGFIRWPFIVEGIVIGLLSSVVSILVIGLLYNIIVDNILNSSINLNLTPLSFNDMFSLLVTVYLILGIGIGIVGSTLSMRKYLEV